MMDEQQPAQEPTDAPVPEIAPEPVPEPTPPVEEPVETPVETPVEEPAGEFVIPQPATPPAPEPEPAPAPAPVEPTPEPEAPNTEAVATEAQAEASPYEGDFVWVRCPDGTPGEAYVPWGVLPPGKIVQLGVQQVDGVRFVVLTPEEMATLVPDPLTHEGRNPLAEFPHS